MDQEDNIPQRVGEEYGGLVEEYLQIIVENRREQHYLLDQVSFFPSQLSHECVSVDSGRLEGLRDEQERDPALPRHLHGA